MNGTPVNNNDSIAVMKRNTINYLMKYYKGDHFESKLSNSALSTALAALTLGLYSGGKDAGSVDNRNSDGGHINKSISWLMDNRNFDGGWGDTIAGETNISTTLICWGTLKYFSGQENRTALNIKKLNTVITEAEEWLKPKLGDINSKNITRVVLSLYGKDNTFSVPILTMLAISGALGEEEGSPGLWKFIPQLPFEFSAIPRKFFTLLNLRVVSYALPALIAMGLVKHLKCPAKNPLTGMIRNRIIPGALLFLEKLQPPAGGFLEAAPLTAFVVMSLIAAGYGKSPVVKRGIGFLRTSMRSDGGCPIDSNLNIWVTTLAVNAGFAAFKPEEAKRLKAWIMARQYKNIHAFTRAAPGGWGWAEAEGSVPDGDDSAGALLALGELGLRDRDVKKAALRGVGWIMGIQNRNGGIPAFCKGWGRLPFDAGCPDISAHALRALIKWRPLFNKRERKKTARAIKKIIGFLAASIRKEGSWIPLWFGNQGHVKKQNPVFGTAQVLLALREVDLKSFPQVTKLISRSVAYLKKAQNRDGGWGGSPGLVSTIEETALAINALTINREEHRESLEKAVFRLKKLTRGGQNFPPAPIGLYFAALWYDEELYPALFTLGALENAFPMKQPPEIHCRGAVTPKENPRVGQRK